MSSWFDWYIKLGYYPFVFLTVIGLPLAILLYVFVPDIFWSYEYVVRSLAVASVFVTVFVALRHFINKKQGVQQPCKQLLIEAMGYYYIYMLFKMVTYFMVNR